MNSQSRIFIGNYGPFGWEDGKVENEKWVSQKKIFEKWMEKWKDRKNFNFLHLCLVRKGWKGGKVEKWKFFLIDWEEKKWG